MTEHLLLIPTLNLSLLERCISSFEQSLAHTNTSVIAIYNGAENGISTKHDGRTLIIGSEDSDRLATAFAEIAGCPRELLFGDRKYGRSYGGASNLLLAGAVAVGSDLIAKVDDDCMETRDLTDSWLASALRFAGSESAVHFGHSTGQPSGYRHELTSQTVSRLGAYLYTKELWDKQQGSLADRVRLKNGILAFDRAVLKSRCYPVLYEPIRELHLRGEIYLWYEELRGAGIPFRYHPELHLSHYPSSGAKLNSWLRSTISGFDLWSVFRFAVMKRYPSRSERVNAIAEFRSWVMSAEWPEVVLPSRLCSLLDDSESLISFTDKIFGEASARRLAWKRLAGADLRPVLREIVVTGDVFN